MIVVSSVPAAAAIPEMASFIRSVIACVPGVDGVMVGVGLVSAVVVARAEFVAWVRSGNSPTFRP